MSLEFESRTFEDGLRMRFSYEVPFEGYKMHFCWSPRDGELANWKHLRDVLGTRYTCQFTVRHAVGRFEPHLEVIADRYKVTFTSYVYQPEASCFEDEFSGQYTIDEFKPILARIISELEASSAVEK